MQGKEQTNPCEEWYVFIGRSMFWIKIVVARETVAKQDFRELLGHLRLFHKIMSIFSVGVEFY